MSIRIPGKRVRRTRLVRTDQYVIVVKADAVFPDADPSEPCYEPATVQLLREIESHARRGDVAWLRRHGKVYAAVDAA